MGCGAVECDTRVVSGVYMASGDGAEGVDDYELKLELEGLMVLLLCIYAGTHYIPSRARYLNGSNWQHSHTRDNGGE
jgi:hypothetical protein